MRLVLFHDDEVGPKFSGRPGQLLDIGILAVARMAEQQSEAATAAAQMIGHSEKSTQAVGIVGIVDQHLHGAHREAHHPAGIVLEVGTEAREHRGDRVRCDTERHCGKRCAGQVCDVVGCNSIHRQRHGGNLPQIVLGAAVAEV